MNYNRLQLIIFVLLFLLPISSCGSRDKNHQLVDAVNEGKLEKVKELVSEGANPNFKIDDGSTPLHFAAVGNHEEVVEFLLEKGADINAKKEDGETPLHFAFFMHNKGMVEFLISKGADPKVKDNNGNSVFSVQKEMMEALETQKIE